MALLPAILSNNLDEIAIDQFFVIFEERSDEKSLVNSEISLFVQDDRREVFLLFAKLSILRDLKIPPPFYPISLALWRNQQVGFRSTKVFLRYFGHANNAEKVCFRCP